MQHNQFRFIGDFFDKDFFADKGSVATNAKIQSTITEFTNCYPNLITDFLKELRDNFKSATIENHTQFFNNDRCIRFLVQINHNERYIIQIGIFEMFSVYKHSFKILNGKYSYDSINFINERQSTFTDLFYKCLPMECQHFPWLDSDILDTIVSDFSTIEKDPRLSHIVKLADVLFTKHYI